MAQEEVENGGAEKVAALKFTALKPQLMVEAPKAVDAVQFYKSAFGAFEVGRTVHPKRKAKQVLPHILSAQLELAGSTIIVSDIVENSAPMKTEGGGCVLCLETDDIEAVVAKAVSAGGVAKSEIAEDDGACYGGRVGKVKDPYGYVWLICWGFYITDTV
ncbi:hypothetical protein F3Y22_tig00111621pilonHSYRG00467 [Hibiscus syriacus]|uniref:VOC domain-containing protein n=1 Tax=Hibiscus syriacus TaxID=106335 RepID=A0A6A2YJC6_HIBSY|nr:uncharacterized protein At5g48480-like [Hibiscus syriacus]KAE8676294.1 hypothetical protein F3Y22_tig00111621pilonHSYRG00467 [Hibiscus syriacus]